MKLKNETLNALSKIDTTILRKKWGAGQKYETVSAIEVFKDILRNGDIEESESLNRFIEKCSGAYDWQSTGSATYKFINLNKVDGIFENLTQIERANSITITETLELS